LLALQGYHHSEREHGNQNSEYDIIDYRHDIPRAAVQSSNVAANAPEALI
jgi:hypothetical protein